MQTAFLKAHITGDASDRDKFNAWAATVPNTLRNPLYDWTHLELRRAFGINTLLSPETADEIWNNANERLQGPRLFRPRSPPKIQCRGRGHDR